MSMSELMLIIGPERQKNFEAYLMVSRLHVVIGILRDNQGRILITRRDRKKHKGGLWEFPGGKVELGESSRQAICRELREEISIEVIEMEHYMDIFHDYGDLNVYLEVFNVTNYRGRAQAAEGQRQTWTSVDRAIDPESEFCFPEANYPILRKLFNEARPAVSD